MKERFFRLIGKILAFIGMIIILFTTMAVLFRIGMADSITVTPSDILLLLVFIPPGFILTYCGVIIHRRFREVIPFLTKDGEPIHSGKPWKKGSESGLFLTSCGLVVSINQESRTTAHVGYKIVTAKQATHRDCVLKEGRAVLDNFAHGRIY